MPSLYLGNFRANQEFPENRLSTTETPLSDEKRVCKGNVVKHLSLPTAFHLNTSDFENG